MGLLGMRRGWGKAGEEKKRRGGKKGIILKSSISSSFMQLKKGFEYVILC